MTGGLIQLVTYGSQDIFLTGNPEITFFKIVYLRHTNFAQETIEEHFDGTIDFGEEVSCTLSNHGDLAHKMALKIDIPEVNLTKDNSHLIKSYLSSSRLSELGELDEISELQALEDEYQDKKISLTNQVSSQETKYQDFDAYASVISRLYRRMLQDIVPQTNSIGDVYTAVSEELNDYNKEEDKDDYESIIQLIDNKTHLAKTNLLDLIDEIDNTLDSDYSSNDITDIQSTLEQLQETDSNLNVTLDRKNAALDDASGNSRYDIQDDIDELQEDIEANQKEIKLQKYLLSQKILASKKSVLKSKAEKLIDLLKRYHLLYLRDYQTAKNNLNTFNNNQINFAWIKYLGHYIINSISVDVGGERIEFHSNDWLQIYHNMRHRNEIKEIYHKMIGNIKILTNYSQDIKPSYSLLIPLQFFFNRYNGNALPLIALKHHDIKINVKFNELERCCFFDYDNQENDLVNKINLIGASIWVDYIFLDQEERKKFAQSTHEYLIEQVRQVEYDIISRISNTEINLSQPCKEIYFVLQRKKYRNQLNQPFSFEKDFTLPNTYENTWENRQKYPHLLQSNKSPIVKAQIQVYGVDRTPKLSPIYYNSLQSVHHHTASPEDDGIHLYSFAINPEEYQPSGAINLSRVGYFTIWIQIEQEYLDEIKAQGDELVLKVFAITNNIFRVMGGLGGLAFTF